MFFLNLLGLGWGRTWGGMGLGGMELGGLD